jgi:UPF0271 protein
LKRIDLSVDIGEGFGFDRELLRFATSGNVCCGEHAGSWEHTRETVELCRSRGVRVGMHPGFPDRESLGRRMPHPDEMDGFARSVQLQTVRFLTEFETLFLKAHGAWYNAACASEGDPRVRGVCQGLIFGIALGRDLPTMLLPGSFAAEALKRQGGKVIAEGFADRAYRDDGTLVPRSEPGAVLDDPEIVKRQVLRLASTVDSICLHGDTPGCVEFAELVFKTLADAGFEVAA